MTTAVGIAIMFAVIVVWDALLYRTERETISEVFAVTGKRYPLVKAAVIFSMGVLAGHWFWPMCQ